MSAYSEINSIEFEQILAPVVQFFKSNQMLKDKTLVIPISFSVSDCRKDIHVYKNVTLYFHSPSNYTKVAVFYGDNIDETKIEFIADHDSCWRDGISRAISKVREEILKDFQDSDINDVSVFNSIGIRGISLIDKKIYGSYDEKYITLK